MPRHQNDTIIGSWLTDIWKLRFPSTNFKFFKSQKLLGVVWWEV